MSETQQQRAILVIDDEPLVAEATQLLLEDSGYTAVTATQWSEVSALIAANEFDLVISDVQMPPLDSGEMIDRVHRARPALPIIAMSANAQAGARALANGANVFLSKPCHGAPLLRAMNGLLSAA